MHYELLAFSDTVYNTAHCVHFLVSLYTYLSDINKANLATGFILMSEEHGRL